MSGFFDLLWKLGTVAAILAGIGAAIWFFRSGKATKYINMVKDYVNPRRVGSVQVMHNNFIHMKNIEFYDMNGAKLDNNTLSLSASQSSTYVSPVVGETTAAENVIDTSLTTYNHTLGGPAEWLKVVLGKPQQLSQVVLLGRDGLVLPRLLGIKIQIKDTRGVVMLEYTNIDISQPVIKIPIPPSSYKY